MCDSFAAAHIGPCHEGCPGSRRVKPQQSSLVTFELIVLALATAVRPASLAVVYALLGGPSPRRYMVAYVLAGATFTITFGFLVIWVFHGIAIHPESSHTKAIAEICGGVLAIIL